MNAIEKLFPVSQQERSFQLKVRRDAGTAAPGWVQPQFVECKKCGRRATRQVWTKSLYVCPNCGVHLPIGAYYRLSTILDHGTFKELNPDLAPNDVLHFPDYQLPSPQPAGSGACRRWQLCWTADFLWAA